MNFYPAHWYRQPGYLGQAPDPNAPPPGPPPGAMTPPPAASPAVITPPAPHGKFDGKALVSPAIGAATLAALGALSALSVHQKGKPVAIAALVGAALGGLAGWKLVEIKPLSPKLGA